VAAADVTARGASVGVAFDSPSGWTFGAAAGGTGSNDPSGVTSAALSAFAATPANRAAVFTVNASRTPLDYTLPLVRNRVVMTEGVVSVEARRGRDWDFGAAAGVATYDVRASGRDSRRISFRTTARRRLNDRFAILLGARALGFDRDLNGGFFDPDAYGLVDVAVVWHHEPSGWLLDAEVAPGIQRIGSAGRTTGALRATASVAWQIRPGRELTARGTFANAGLQQLGDVDGGAYRYASFGIGFAWWF
jgi:hypothetical protein